MSQKKKIPRPLKGGLPSCFAWHRHQLRVEDVSVAALVERHGSPLYVYAQAEIKRAVHEFQEALANVPHLICFAVKANSNLAILQLLGKEGLGADVVSLGELERSCIAGIPPQKIVFSGVAKSRYDLRAALSKNIFSINVESRDELELLIQIAKDSGHKARLCLRLNPDINPKTHPKIATGLKETKFGLSWQEILAVLPLLKKHRASLELAGLSCHIGSQILELAPFRAAAKDLRTRFEYLRQQGFPVAFLDVGGGLGVSYQEEDAPALTDYIGALKSVLHGLQDFTLVLEPGRRIVARSGILLTRVMTIKDKGKKTMAITDAGMSELLRPALYDAFHRIEPVVQNTKGAPQVWDIVGPYCETGDVLGHNRRMQSLQVGDLLAVFDAGAYGMSMASQYNSHPRPAEILVDGSNDRLIRERESLSDLWARDIL